MKKKPLYEIKNLKASEICFGLNRETDEQSLAAFISKFGDAQLLGVLLPRITDEEIDALVDTLTRLMRAHLSEKEYHRLFLND